MRTNVVDALAQFLSTLPARGATVRSVKTAAACSYFYPRSPRGERPWAMPSASETISISIHAPREGSDVNPGWVIISGPISIHAPREGSDEVLQGAGVHLDISIHAPREGSDDASPSGC